MKEPTDRSHETDSHASEFQQLLDEITSRQLDARTINTYADEALEDLVALVQKAVDMQSLTTTELSGIEKERQALEDVELNPYVVESTLDHIAEVAASTKRLDALMMKKTKLVNVVMVPPDSSKRREITPSDGSFEKPKERIPKRNTLLLLLEKGLDVDIESDDVSSEEGVITQNMMRSISYNMVEISSLQRRVLVCDEVGNTTFVFDTNICDEYEISSSDIWELTKDDIKDLLEYIEGFGRKIDYSKDYVNDLAKALTEPIVPLNESEKVEKVTLLKQKEVIDHIPEGYMLFAAMCDRLDLTVQGLERRIQKISREEFGEILKYRQPGMRVAVRILSPSQQDFIGYDKFALGDAELTEIPENYILFNDLAEELGVHKTTLSYRIEMLGEKFGKIQKIQQGVRGTRVLSPDQQTMLRLQNEYTPGGEHVPRGESLLPDGSISALEMAERLQITLAGLTLRISKLDPNLFGEKLYHYRRLWFSPVQQTLLLEQYEQVLDYIPDGYVTVRMIAEALNVSESAVLTRIRRAKGEEFGAITLYREPRAKQSASYLLSTEQQEWLRKKYEQVLDHIPDRYMLYDDICAELNITKPMLRARIGRFKDTQFGTILKYRLLRSKSNASNLLSPKQQELLRKQDMTIKGSHGKAVIDVLQRET